MNWQWMPATGADITEMVDQAQVLFEIENPDDHGNIIFELDPMVFSHHITRAIVNQYYEPGSELIYIARDTQTGKLLAQTWINRVGTPLWSRDEMALTQMAHVDYNLSIRSRVTLISQMMDMWETWCRSNKIPIISSSTMRQKTDGFLKMHLKRGYSLRGTVAYKRLT
jgi:hypothetical protein